MKLKFDKVLYIKIFFALFITSLIIFLSNENIIWSNFWSFLKIPPNYIPFSDFKAHVYFLECFNKNIDIYNEECNLINEGNAKISSHPKIWVYLFDFLNLNKIIFFKFSAFILLFFYLFFLFDYQKKFQKPFHKFFFYLLFFSTTNFILIERLSTDIVIFLITYMLLLSNKKFFQITLIFFGFFLKYFPIFLCSIFLQNKKILFALIVSFIIIVFTFYLKNLDNINNNIIEMALPIAYGSRTMLKAAYHLSEEYNLFLNEDNLAFFRYLIVVFFAIYSLSLIMVGYNKSEEIDLKLEFNKDFIVGASIYVGTYIIGSNADYRLMFLIFTIPLILKLKNKTIQYSLLVSIFFSFNSFYFLIGDKLSIIFFMASAFIFLLKFVIFSLISLIIGSQLRSIHFFGKNYV